ncbi:hypothetical protein OESDEN_00535 [Oesophagostomum dentatum]|uniref:Uncharacterized protein n=1 Tax=Oesophagostomum dentatum TaxID=61180 RepID=A0A0B1TQF5_OESDE|nr:hypothetical protein OESDEN_00535 [Oesophagostomum dentatum]
MRAVTRPLKLGSSALKSMSYRLCSTAESSGSSIVPTSSLDEFDEFVESIGRDVTDLSKGLTFSRMLRQSKFMQLGDFSGRLVTGRVVHRVQDDLYVDFGLKFNGVCKVPSVNSEAYREGAIVLLRLQDPELSERFLGSEHDLTLLEADATLIRLLRPASSRGILFKYLLNN